MMIAGQQAYAVGTNQSAAVTLATLKYRLFKRVALGSSLSESG